VKINKPGNPLPALIVSQFQTKLELLHKIYCFLGSISFARNPQAPLNMRFSFPSVSLLSLLFTTKSLACVQFRAQIDFEYTNEAFVSAQLSDEGGLTCWSTQQAVDQTQYSYVWLDCIDRYSATFSWINPNPVNYAYPGFSGQFATNADGGYPDGTPYGVLWDYSADVWGCPN
jgi:hypothetical protein